MKHLTLLFIAATCFGQVTFKENGVDVPVLDRLKVAGYQTNVPATLTSACILHQYALDAEYRYDCISTNTWKKTPNAATLMNPAAGKGGDLVAYNANRTVGSKLADTPSAADYSGATVSDRIDAAIADLGSSGFLIIPASMGAGSPTSTPLGVTIFDFRGGTNFGGSLNFGSVTGSGQRARLWITESLDSFDNSTTGLYVIEKVHGDLPANQTTASGTFSAITQGALTTFPAGQTLVGTENNVAIDSTGGLTIGATAFPTESTHIPIRGMLANVAITSGNTSVGVAAAAYTMNLIKAPGATGTYYNAFGQVNERQTNGSVSNYSEWNQGDVLFSNNLNIDGIDSAHAPQHVLTLTSTDYVMARPLADANGWTFRNQAGNVSWLDLSSAHTRVPISSRFLIGDDTEPISGFAATYSVGGSSEVIFRDTTQTTGNKNWNVGNSLTYFIIRPSDDSGGATNNGITVDRSGNTVIWGTIQSLTGLKTVDGTAGATGTCTGAPVVKNGLVVSCAGI